MQASPFHSIAVETSWRREETGRGYDESVPKKLANRGTMQAIVPGDGMWISSGEMGRELRSNHAPK
jgi:hypothetical protein